jgi:sterol desaturase/sphingolipid hydroxylase (fatty acid hydroxylase superfamily)
VIEFFWHRVHGREGYDLGETAATTAIAVGQSFTRYLSAFIIVPGYYAIYQWRLFDIPLFDPLALVALFLGQELCYYWFHRASHTVRWMWATHRVHHSATKFNLSAAYRLGWTNLISAGWLFYAPLLLIGFQPVAVIGAIGLSLAYQFLLHTELVPKLGPLEFVLNTPTHHRVHHASNETCLDKNYGGTLIIFDRLFGTFVEAPQGEALRYGLVGETRTLNPFKLAFGEWIQMARDVAVARSAKDAFIALFGKPQSQPAIVETRQSPNLPHARPHALA